MKTLQNLEVNRPVILDNTYQYQGQEQRIYINKSMFQKKEQYFLQLALPQKVIFTFIWTINRKQVTLLDFI